MRLTVGPLPASVYWRRRAVVLGSLLVAILAVSYTCSGQQGDASKSGVPASPKASATTALAPANLTSPSASPSASASPAQVAVSASASAAGDEVVDPKACTDAELKVTASPVKTTLNSGQDLLIYLLIKNTSNRTCTRDIGPDLQELRIVQGADKIWSSDDCDAPRGNNVQSFRPGLEVSFNVDWNGHLSTSCSTTAKRTPTGPLPEAGKYQVIARVGTKLSPAVTITVK
ncbi:hypothetical protein [Hamadaea tsunoensis]|uniref:hypothetical protein n=1 Tax=Hamadaea tsunoensis TaxID=53368 RepID=UPI00048706FA|nr:hypothetical protein [Hamadaea tsunoensis]